MGQAAHRAWTKAQHRVKMPTLPYKLNRQERKRQRHLISATKAAPSKLTLRTEVIWDKRCSLRRRVTQMHKTLNPSASSELTKTTCYSSYSRRLSQCNMVVNLYSRLMASSSMSAQLRWWIITISLLTTRMPSKTGFRRLYSSPHRRSTQTQSRAHLRPSRTTVLF